MGLGLGLGGSQCKMAANLHLPFSWGRLLKDIAWSVKDFYRIWKGIEISNVFTLGLGPETADTVPTGHGYQENLGWETTESSAW